ncbi:MAG: hypothetical protein K0U98_08135 [Deltaproteobacteria bacterium]|nr:hypothetical protein [Deltaproteobacteria bacterium]
MMIRRLLSAFMVMGVILVGASPASAAIARCQWFCNQGPLPGGPFPGASDACSCFSPGVGYLTTTCGVWWSNGDECPSGGALEGENKLEPPGSEVASQQSAGSTPSEEIEAGIIAAGNQVDVSPDELVLAPSLFSPGIDSKQPAAGPRCKRAGESCILQGNPICCSGLCQLVDEEPLSAHCL